VKRLRSVTAEKGGLSFSRNRDPAKFSGVGMWVGGTNHLKKLKKLVYCRILEKRALHRGGQGAGRREGLQELLGRRRDSQTIFLWKGRGEKRLRELGKKMIL